ncbi:hypothetical protein [Brevundimonas fluminis]|uniref:hypothetical protein n=1 Tax=Brevundimonas fluminis TaxID=2487274 RepID=UPI000F657258|nr:hypothetical protein [Brevundimonas fluminis]
MGDQIGDDPCGVGGPAMMEVDADGLVGFRAGEARGRRRRGFHLGQSRLEIRDPAFRPVERIPAETERRRGQNDGGGACQDGRGPGQEQATKGGGDHG